MSDEQLTSKQRRRAEKRRREKEAKAAGDISSLTSSSINNTTSLTSSTSVVVANHSTKLPAKIKWNFVVDYNDHFETPLVAYQDITPLLQRLAVALGKDPHELIIYDPYYCKGGMVGLLEQVGFPRVINKNRDFYTDVANKQTPFHDILVTNPPYSGEHKPKLLTYLLSQVSSTDATTCRSSSTVQPLTAFALLLPIYTATKSYWKEFASEFVRRTCDNNSLFYLVPPDCYEYQHPEGTGKDIPPFKSAWFIGLSTAVKGMGSGKSGGESCGLDVMEVRRALESATAATAAGGAGVRVRGGCAVYSTVEQLAAAGHVVADRRPNPKQRKKMMKMRAASEASTTGGGGDRRNDGHGGGRGSGSVESVDIGSGGNMPSFKKRRY